MTNDASQVNKITIYAVLGHGGQYTIVLVYVIAAKLLFVIIIYHCNCTRHTVDCFKCFINIFIIKVSISLWLFCDLL